MLSKFLSICILHTCILFGNLHLTTSTDLNDCEFNTNCDLDVRDVTTDVPPMSSSQESITESVDDTDEEDCADLDLDDVENLTQMDLLNRLTSTCRYDRLERPTVFNDDGSPSPLKVFTRTFIDVMQSTETSSLQLTLYGVMQVRYVDPRLAFAKYAPGREKLIIGEGILNDKIWMPHVLFTNVHEMKILGTNEKDILTSISPDGTVEIMARIRATLFCWANAWKFPFDEQHCSMQLSSLKYTESELLLNWESELPTKLNSFIKFQEYFVINSWCSEGSFNINQHYSNYSMLTFTVHMARKSNRYILSYFLPSVIIVAITWISFWLEPSKSASPRTTLGLTTLLSFITLTLNMDDKVAKLGYVMISDIWFLGCNLFISGSLVEFAFVLAITMRRRNVVLKKVNSKHVLKSTMIPRNKVQKQTALSGGGGSSNSLELSIDNSMESVPQNYNASMTPQEIALWIDTKSRFVFPLAFLIFNVIFWTLAYCL